MARSAADVRATRAFGQELARSDKPVDDEVRGLLDDRASAAANYAAVIAVLAVLALMVWQPG